MVRITIAVPQVIEVPVSGSKSYRIMFYIQDNSGVLMDVDSNILAVVIQDENGNPIVSGSATYTHAPGIFYYDFSVSSSATYRAAIVRVGYAKFAVPYADAAQIAVLKIRDGIWNALRSNHTTVLTFGEGAASVQGNVTGSVASVTGNVSGNVNGNVDGSVDSVTDPVVVGTNNDKTNYEIAGTKTKLDDLHDAPITSPPTVGQIAVAIWDEELDLHTGEGNTGQALLAAEEASGVWDVTIAEHLATGSTGRALAEAADLALVMGEYEIDQDGWYDNDHVLHPWNDEAEGYIVNPDGSRADDVIVTAFLVVDDIPVMNDKKMQAMSDSYGMWRGKLDAGDYLITMYKDGNKYFEVLRTVG